MTTNIKSEEKSQKLTDDERHQRFKDMAREVEASEKPEDFDRAFERIVAAKTNPKSSD